MTDETKRVTRAELAEAIGDQHWGWLADTNNPRALRAVADAIFDALPADRVTRAEADGDKLRTLATWFDDFDDWREATGKIAPGITDYREVQGDLRRMAAIFDALPADPPASAGHNHAGDFCDPLTCPWRPASADVDEAREALLAALAGNRDAPVIDRLNDFETAVDKTARSEAYRQGYESAVYDSEAKLREAWDDVEDEAAALHLTIKAVSADVDAARAALLGELAESPLPGARYAHDVVSRRLDALIAAVRAESAETLAALREAVAAHHPSGEQCLFLAATPAEDGESAIRAESAGWFTPTEERLRQERDAAEAKLAALREAVAVTLTEPFDLDPLRKAYQETIGTTGHLSLAATPAETFWLVERGQSEGQVPTVWWGHSGWWDTVNEAERYPTRQKAQQVVDEQFTPPLSRGGPIAHVTEHSWIAPTPAEEGLDVERLAEAIRGAMLEAGLGSGVSLGVPERIAPLIVARLAEAER